MKKALRMSTAWSCINESTLQSGAILQPLSATAGSAAGCCVSCAFMQPSRMCPTEGGAVHLRCIQYVAVGINGDEEAGGKQQPEDRGD